VHYSWFNEDRSSVDSAYCMYEFEIALYHNIVVKRKKRLVVLMALDSPINLHVDDDDDAQTAALRRYLRQYTYIDFTASGWIDNLLYALPLHGMDRQDADALQHADDDAILLQ